jgi:hypothetical protein
MKDTQKQAMKIYLEKLEEIETCDLLRDRARFSKEHTLVDDPELADVIILTGHFGRAPEMLFDNPTYRKYTGKCTTYDEFDHFVPLIPGVYCNSKVSQHSKIGRIFSFAHISRNGSFPNPHVQHRPHAEKKYFFSFQGGSTCIVRKRLFLLNFNRDDVLIENTSSYGHWEPNPGEGHEDRQKFYGETISASHFVLCPRGSGPSSIRLFEVMKAGIAPVLIADNYLLPPDIDWDSFLIRVKESDIAKLPKILEPLLPTAAERGRLAHEAYLANFAENVEFDRVANLCARSLHHGPPEESYFRARQKKIIASEARRHARYAFARKTALTILRVLRIKNPFQMHR